MYKREHSKVEQKSRGKYLTCARKTRPSQKLEGGDELGARVQAHRDGVTCVQENFGAVMRAWRTNRESKPRLQHGAGEELLGTRTHDNSEHRGARRDVT